MVVGAAAPKCLGVFSCASAYDRGAIDPDHRVSTIAVFWRIAATCIRGHDSGGKHSDLAPIPFLGENRAACVSSRSQDKPASGLAAKGRRAAYRTALRQQLRRAH